MTPEKIKPPMASPSEYLPDSHIGHREEFAGIVGRNTSDYLMQTAQRHHMLLSQMADNKANMLITVSSLVLTISMSRINDELLRPTILVLAGFTLAAMFMAILAVLPKYKPLNLGNPDQLPEWFNPIFFAHFSELPRDRFFKLMGSILRSDPSVYEALTNDLYSIGTYLARHKYRYLRFAYIFFLLGFFSAASMQVAQIFI